MKELIVRAVRRETEIMSAPRPRPGKAGFKLPHVRLNRGRKLDLTGFDFDGLLG